MRTALTPGRPGAVQAVLRVRSLPPAERDRVEVAPRAAVEVQTTANGEP